MVLGLPLSAKIDKAGNVQLKTSNFPSLLPFHSSIPLSIFAISEHPFMGSAILRFPQRLTIDIDLFGPNAH